MLTYADVWQVRNESIRLSAMAADERQHAQVHVLVIHTYAHVCARMLTYAGTCSRMLTHAHVCSHMLTYARVC
jgi:hypothetical protein